MSGMEARLASQDCIEIADSAQIYFLLPKGILERVCHQSERKRASESERARARARARARTIARASRVRQRERERERRDGERETKVALDYIFYLDFVPFFLSTTCAAKHATLQKPRQTYEQLVNQVMDRHEKLTLDEIVCDTFIYAECILFYRS